MAGDYTWLRQPWQVGTTYGSGNHDNKWGLHKSPCNHDNRYELLMAQATKPCQQVGYIWLMQPRQQVGTTYGSGNHDNKWGLLMAPATMITSGGLHMAQATMPTSRDNIWLRQPWQQVGTTYGSGNHGNKWGQHMAQGITCIQIYYFWNIGSAQNVCCWDLPGIGCQNVEFCK